MAKEVGGRLALDAHFGNSSVLDSFCKVAGMLAKKPAYFVCWQAPPAELSMECTKRCSTTCYLAVRIFLKMLSHPASPPKPNLYSKECAQRSAKGYFILHRYCK